MNQHLLLMSLLTLLSPPMAGRLLKKYHKAAGRLAFVAFAYILYAIIFELMPHSFENLGAVSLLIPIMGFLATAIAEQHILKSVHGMGKIMTVFIMLFFLLHSLMDGASIYLASSVQSSQHIHSHHSLGYSVILHRLIAVNLLWIALTPSLGVRKISMFLVTIGLGTIVGYHYSHPILGSFHNSHFLLEGLVSGSLLHFNIGILRKRE